MRYIALAATIGFWALISPPAQAQAAIAPSEVPLEISAHGVVHNPPDSITINIPINASGETAVAARAANQATIDKLTRDLLAQGIDRGAVRLVPVGMTAIGFVGNESFDPDNPMIASSPGAIAAAAKHKSASSMLQIKLTDPAKVETVRRVLDLDDQAMAGPPQLALADDGTARRAAVAIAIAKARADADSYAAPLGMKVTRVTRVSNHGSSDVTDSYAAMADVMAMAQPQSTNDVATSATVWIDFVMVPR